MKLVIFDFDGVLVDTLIMHYEISKKINKNMSLDMFRSIFSGNIYDSLKNNPAIKQHPQFFEQYEDKSRELKVPQSLKGLIGKLSKEHTLAIVSSTPSALIRKILKQEAVLNYFSDVLGADVNTSKVIKIRMLLGKYKIKQEDAVFITDTTGDIFEALECGVKAIAVTWGFHEEKTLEKSNPAKIVRSPEELFEAVKQILC